MEPKTKQQLHKLLSELSERAKELQCLYLVEELLNDADESLDIIFTKLVSVFPSGWQYPESCETIITYGRQTFTSGPFETTPWHLSANLIVQEEIVGNIKLFYTQQFPEADIGPFLKEEKQLLDTIANRVSHYILFQRLREIKRNLAEVSSQDSGKSQDWRGPLKMLRNADRELYMRLSRKMLNYMCSVGVEEAFIMLQGTPCYIDEPSFVDGELNNPVRKQLLNAVTLQTNEPFELAARHISGEEILGQVQKWIQEDKAGYLFRVLDNQRSTHQEVQAALSRFNHMGYAKDALPEHTRRGMCVSLIRRFIGEQADYVIRAKDVFEITDFSDLLNNLIAGPNSLGKVGGKGAGIVLAKRILERIAQEKKNSIGNIYTPKTWFLASDALFDFIRFNDLEDIIEQKYKDIDQVRHEYPHIVHLFKNSCFPPQFVQNLSIALDDFGDKPLIIRSSSLLEDRYGTAFSGKYKSLFVANQGDKSQRLEALMDAIAEVYASTFSPDAIVYRREHGLLDVSEEMGILIQEVVGKKIGRYFLPSFAGVAFSNNEFRWSPRIKREDGLIRIVPGLGTRAVDRLEDDYPILTSPGQPGLRVNVNPEEVLRYSPQKIDLIDLEDNCFTTMPITKLLQEINGEYPELEKVFSVYHDGMFSKPIKLMLDPKSDTLVANFHGLFEESPFIEHLGNILKELENALHSPVDVEFAMDGTDFYLLQCRPQSFSEESAPAVIPQDIPEERIIFTANKFVSNGSMPDISHIVYVVPSAYENLKNHDELRAVGKAVGLLNKQLPKRQFILMGPGRWGSRGDIKLGVRVTYSDINNTAMIVEIARKKGNYVPDLSFGTHFFQDLVESSIRYLPLYPDEDQVLFNEQFFLQSTNLIEKILPQYAYLHDVIKVIDINSVTNGKILRILMNADFNRAVALISSTEDELQDSKKQPPLFQNDVNDDYWRWRLHMAERIATAIDAQAFGVVAMYVFGSTKNATAGVGSDIDLLIHFRGKQQQKNRLLDWLNGWSVCLGELNYLRTGYKTEKLLDVHIITDEDIAKRSSFASKIDAVTDAARELPLGG